LVSLPTLEELDAVLDEIVQVYDGFIFEPRKIDMDAMAYSCDS
jgi:hypothetical protein